MRFIEAFPTVQDLAAADEDRVLRLWQGLGYYSRARNLHAAAKMVAADTDRKTPFPDSFEQLRKLPGVGDYTAGAIAAFAYNLPHPALDGNVYRVLSRLSDCEIPFDTTEGKKHFRAIAEELLDRDHPRLFDSAIMELGALHCTPTSPDCPCCPLRDECKAYASGTVELLPVRKERPKVTERRMSYILYLTPERKTLIHKRTERDIWQGLWEVVEVSPSEIPHGVADHRQYVHQLSHRRIIADFYTLPVHSLPKIADTRIVGLEELDEYGFSRLTLRYMNECIALQA